MGKISYLDWLKTYGINNNYDTTNDYNLLFKKLFNTPFISLVDFDSNRIYEALEIRREYLIETTGKLDLELEELKTCNMLELLISLAIRAESMTFDSKNHISIYEWFWTFIHNLGLDSMRNEAFDGRICDSVLFTFIDRKYHKSGKGGLFPLRNYKKDQRKVEIWYQMSAYINENH